MVYVCRKEFFNAAHKLYNHNWSKEKNEEILALVLMRIGTDIISS